MRLPHLSRRALPALVAFCSAALSAVVQAAPPSTQVALPPARGGQGDMVGGLPPILDPNRARFPRSSLHDFSDLLPAPGAQKGFLSSRNGHFYWGDGTRARFWGINVANTSLQVPDAEIDGMIANFRAAGFNLVRLHHFDERDGIIDLNAPDSRRLLNERLRKLDYWIYKAKQAGIVVYLDLLDYRHFKAGDGVANAEAVGRAARPYAVFDARLIELQKEYARKLLREHVNSYTGLAYADNPTIAMVELYDESGLFMRRGVWRQMPEPYATKFRSFWNAYLKKQYVTTDALRRAWTPYTPGTTPAKSELRPNESLEAGNVSVPALTWTPEQVPVNQRAYAGLSRRTDGARFAYGLHRLYFRDMKSYLRGLGVKVPICATGRFDDEADLRSMSDELDYIGTNFYYDHPRWGANAPSWQPPSYYHNANPMSHIDELSFAAQIGLARVAGKPLVVREWNYCWPNRNRAAGMIEAASFGALHDIDAMILFCYETKATPRVSYFNVRSDPSRWGLCGVGAQIFLKGLVQPSRYRIVVPYGPLDTFLYTKYHQPFYALGWATRVENAFYDGDTYTATDPQRTLILTPGRSGLGKFVGAPAVLWTSTLRRDSAGNPLPIPEYLREYGISVYDAGRTSLTYSGLIYNERAQRERNLDFALPLAGVLRNGYTPIGTNPQHGAANGFVDAKNQRFVFGNLDPADALRAGLDALQEFKGVPNRHDANDLNIFTSDTGELFRDAASGRLIVSTPQVQALCGNLVGVGRVMTAGLRARNLKNGVLVALSLDGRPLVSSQNFMIKMVTDARNADEVAAPDPRFAGSPEAQWKLTQLGQGPVTTYGKANATPMQVSIEHQQLVDVYQTGGSWELLVNGSEWKFWSDVPGARVRLHRPTNNLQEVRAGGGVKTLAARPSGDVPFPAGAALLRASG